jgi:sugar phosphate permease
MLDVGAILGSMTLGRLSDLTFGRRSPVALLAVILASLIAFSLKFFIFEEPRLVLLLSMFFLGFLISGLNNLI